MTDPNMNSGGGKELEELVRLVKGKSQQDADFEIDDIILASHREEDGWEMG